MATTSVRCLFKLGKYGIFLHKRKFMMPQYRTLELSKGIDTEHFCTRDLRIMTKWTCYTFWIEEL